MYWVRSARPVSDGSARQKPRSVAPAMPMRHLATLRPTPRANPREETSKCAWHPSCADDDISALRRRERL